MSAPKGFRKVETALGGFWKPTKKGQSVMGVITEKVTLKGVEGKDNVFFSLRLTTEEAGPIEDSEGKSVKPRVGMLVGVSGAVIRTFATGREGREVYLEFQGMGKPKGGKQAPRLYDCYDSEESP